MAALRIGGTVVGGINTAVPVLKAADRARRIRRSAGIAAYVGPNGSGKSLLMAYDTLPTLAGIPWTCTHPDHWHTQEGQTSGFRRVLSTMRFTTVDGEDHPLWSPLHDWRSLVRAEHCDLVLDEISGVANSRDAAGLPTAVQASLQELRRRDVLARFSAPGWSRADKVLRECAQVVTLCLGFMPKAQQTYVTFEGPHDSCDTKGWHEHDAQREWTARRLSFARTYDANTFDEWTTAKKERLHPLARTLMWIPGSLAANSYDSLGYVEKLGQVSEAGLCMDCGGKRRHPQCVCSSPTTRRSRQPAAAGAAQE